MDSSPSQPASQCAKVEGFYNHLREEEESAMNVTTIGLDIAKNVFQAHGVDANGKAALRKQLKRSQVQA